MNSESFKLCEKMLLNKEIINYIFDDDTITLLLSVALQKIGVEIIDFKRKYFIIKTYRVLDTSFVLKEHAIHWKKGLYFSMGMLSKSHNTNLSCEKITKSKSTLSWIQAFTLAYNLNADLSEIESLILKYKGIFIGQKFKI